MQICGSRLAEEPGVWGGGGGEVVVGRWWGGGRGEVVVGAVGRGDRRGQRSFCDLSGVYVTSFSAPVTALILGEGS